MNETNSNLIIVTNQNDQSSRLTNIELDLLDEISISSGNSDLNKIIQAYLKRNKIGWTKNFKFSKVLENYEEFAKCHQW